MLHPGINLAATRIITVQTTLNPKISLNKPMKKCLTYSLLFGIFSAVLLSLFADIICTYLLHNKVQSYLFYIIAISLPFISMSSALNGYFTALRKNGKNALARIFEQFVKITATAYLLSLFMPSGLEYACLSLVFGEAISEIMSFLFVFALYRIERKNYTVKDNTKTNYTKSIFEITLPVSITSYIRSGLASLKQLLIPLRLEKSGMDCNIAISTYGLINGMAMPLLMFPEVIINSFSGLLVPEFTYYYTKNNFNRIREIISKIFRITLLFSIGIIGAFIFYSNNISLVIYNNLDIALYLKILAPLLLFMYLDSIVDNILKGLNQQLSVMKCNILDLFVSIFCIYILLPIWGVNGYIFIIFLSEILNSGISILQLKQITHFKFDFKNWIIKPFIGIAFSYFVCTLLVPNIIPTTSCIILQIALFLGCYFVFLLLSKALEV
ncbi:MAG: oligosaccharide flippase family protein [Clostridia bacterium]|nr:oligosaccharide flippase family protein [Clostridia bacterium]